MIPPQYPICSFNNTPCRFCSNESTYCACTFIQKKDGHYIGVKVGYIKSERGQYCNNICDWIKNLKSCPKEDDLMKGEILEEWEKKSMKKIVVKRTGKKAAVVEKEKLVKKLVKKVVKAPVEKLVKKPVKKTVEKSVKKPVRKIIKKPTKKPAKKLVKKVTPTKKKKPAIKKSMVKKPTTNKRTVVKETPVVKKPKRKYTKKTPVVKKKSVVKKVTPKRKKEIINI